MEYDDRDIARMLADALGPMWTVKLVRRALKEAPLFPLKRFVELAQKHLAFNEKAL